MNRSVYREVQRQEVTPDPAPANPDIWRAPVDTTPVDPTAPGAYSEVRRETVTTTDPAVNPYAPLPATTPAPGETVVRERTVASGPVYTSTEWGLMRTRQIMGYILTIVESLLLIRFVLRLIGANPANAFAQLVYLLTAPFVALFGNLVPNPVVAGTNVVFEITTLIAMLFWALLFAAAWRLVRMLMAPPA